MTPDKVSDASQNAAHNDHRREKEAHSFGIHTWAAANLKRSLDHGWVSSEQREKEESQTGPVGVARRHAVGVRKWKYLSRMKVRALRGHWEGCNAGSNPNIDSKEGMYPLANE